MSRPITSRACQRAGNPIDRYAYFWSYLGWTIERDEIIQNLFFVPQEHHPKCRQPQQPTRCDYAQRNHKTWIGPIQPEARAVENSLRQRYPIRRRIVTTNTAKKRSQTISIAQTPAPIRVQSRRLAQSHEIHFHRAIILRDRVAKFYGPN